ncbi:T9SS type A sorting domain-containing protein [Bacteroidota bacterium]
MTKNLRFKKLLGVFAIVLATSFVFSQSSYSQTEQSTNQSSENVLYAFSFTDAANAALSADFTTVIDETLRTVTLSSNFPFGTVITALTPTFEASDLSNVRLGATFAGGTAIGSGLGDGVPVLAGAAFDFTLVANRVIWVEAENHSTEFYTLIFSSAAASSDCDLLSFVINGTEYKWTAAHNFAQGACDAGNAIAPATATAMTAGGTIEITLPFGTDLTTLAISGTTNGVSTVYDPGVSNAAAGGVGVVAVAVYDQTAGGNFLVFRVTAEDATFQDYTLNVTVAPANKYNLLTSFTFAGVPGSTAGVIDHALQTVAITVPNGTALGALVPTFTTGPTPTTRELTRSWVGIYDGVAVLPEVCSAVTAIDFSAVVDFSVVAQDENDINTYHITVTVAPPSDCAVLDSIKFTGPVLSTCTGPAWTSGYLYPTAGASQIVYYANGLDITDVTFDFTTCALSVPAEGTLGTIVTGTSYDITATGAAGVYTLVITVTAEDGVTTGVYTFVLTELPASNEKVLEEIGFYFGSPQNTIAGLLADVSDDTPSANNQFVVEVPWFVDLHTMTAYFEASDYACVFIAPPGGGAYVAQTSATALIDGTLNDHSNSITYVVVAQDGTEERYDFEVHKTPASDAKELTAFSFDGLGICSAIVSAPTYDADGVLAGMIYTVTVRYGTDVTALVATFANSALSTVKVGTVVQTSGVTANNFTAAVVYTVTAEDGTTQAYTINVVEHASASYSAKQITEYIIPVALNTGKGLGGFDIVGDIDQAAYTIDCYVPWEARTFVNNLVATFDLNGVDGLVAYPWTVMTRSEDTQNLQLSGSSSNDYTTPIAYTVWAENCTSVEYFVTVHVVPDEDTGISSFTFSYSDCGCDLETKIDPYTKRIYITVPYTVSLTSLAPASIGLAVGATVSPAAGVAKNWTNGPISYVVTAPDGVAKDTWYVIVENPPCELTTLLDDVDEETNVTIGSPSIQIGDPIVDEDTNTIIFTVSATADISQVIMDWDLPCGAEICCNMGACSSSYIDFEANGGCHTCIVTAQAGETITEEWTVCIRREDTTVPEVTVESEIVWNCEDSIGVSASEKGTVWIVEESWASVVAGYQAAGDMEDARDALDDAADDDLAASAAYPVVLDSLGNAVVTYVSTHGLYSGAYYAVAVDSAGNVSKCLSTEMFFIDICEVEVADLCELRDSPLVWRYTVLGEIFVTYECDYIKFAQDATCGIKIDDTADFNHLPTYGRGTGLTNLRGMMYDDGAMTYFVPMICCPPTASSTGNTVTPVNQTWDEFEDIYNGGHASDYESMLVTITNPMMVEDDYWAPNGGFDYWTYSTYWNAQGTDFYTENGFGASHYYILGNFSCSDYIGEDFLTIPGVYTGIQTNTGWGGMITPRDEDDIVAVTGPVIEANPNPLIFAGVFPGTCATETVSIYNTGIGNLPITALYLDNITGDDTFELMTALPTNPHNIVNGTPFDVDVKWCPSVSGPATTTLIVEYGVGLVLEIPINGTTPVTFDAPYFTDFNEGDIARNVNPNVYSHLHGWSGEYDPRAAVYIYGGWGSGYGPGRALNMRTRNYANGVGLPYGGVSVWTPGFNVPTTGDIVVSWQDMRWGTEADPDPRNIWISTDGLAWTLLDSYTWADQTGPQSYDAVTTADFTNKIYSLAAYAGETVYFWFDLTNPTGGYTYWVIDNFAVQERITEPILAATPNPADFGGVQVAETGSIDFSLNNLGISTALIKSIEIQSVTGAGVPTDFVLVDTLYTYPVDVVNGTEAWVENPEASLNFSVDFTPEAIGISQANIVITWGFYADQTYVIPIQGEGLSCEVAFPAQLGENHFFQNSWWEYTPEQFAVVTVTSCHENQTRVPGDYSWDTFLYIYDECGGTLIGSNDDMEGDCVFNRTLSTVTFVAEAGHSYKIFWPLAFVSDHYLEEFIFIVSETYPLAGDICESAIPLDLPVKNMFGTTVGFEDDYNYSSCSPSSNYMDGNDKVYSFTIADDIANGYGYIVGDIFGAYAGIHIVNVCPNDDMLKENCIAFAGGSMGGSFNKRIEPGDYYCVVSSWAPPQTLDFYFNLKLQTSEGVEDVELTSGMEVYPNPSDGKFTLNVNRDEFTDLVIELTDVTGQVLYRNDVKSVMSYTELIDISSFAKGIYHLRVNDGTKADVKKVVIN